jgi:hypothetical protein
MKIMNKSSFVFIKRAAVIILVFILINSLVQPIFAAILISTSSAYTQNFDNIGATATATLPTDWKVDKQATVRTVGTFSSAVTATELVGGNSLSTTAGNGIYNFGAGVPSSAIDRAVGFLSSTNGTKSGNLYAQLINSTGLSLGGVKISYDVEKYRNGLNVAGFSIQLYYSSDGSNWTSAGSNFLTSFSADADNIGFSPAPGATVSVTNQTLSVSIPNGNNFYLAWNYSVTSGSTTSNAQALAIDNVSIQGVSGVTDIVFVSAKANAYETTLSKNAGALVQWRTGMEVSSLGFTIYREDDGKLNRVSPDLIAGSALFAGANTVIRAGRSYTWRDAKPLGATTRYFVEEIDLNGRTQLYGPIYVDSANPVKQFSVADQEDSKLISELNASSSDTTSTESNAGEAALGVQVESLAPMPKLTSKKITAQGTIASQTGAKLSVKQQGWYRITQAELAAVGFNVNIDPRFLQLFVDGVEMPIRVVGEKDGKFNLTDAVEFFGQGLDSNFTNSRTYFLVAASQPGRRITTASDVPGKPGITSFNNAVERKERTIYFSSLRNGEKENFFGAVLARTPLNQTITLDHLANAPLATATLEVAVQGITSFPHLIEVRLNGLQVGEIEFEWQEEGLGRFEVPQALLKEGPNTVTLTPLGGNTDVDLMDYIRLTYQRQYLAVNDALIFTAGGKTRVTIDGFTANGIQVFDVTNKTFPQEVAGLIEPKGATYSVTINVPDGVERTLIAATTAQNKKPVVTLNAPSNWRDANQGADYVIITRKAFIEALTPLVSLRQSKGLKALVIDIEDIYDECSFGQKTPQAVRDFLSYARSNWRIAPRFVLLAADATFDPKDYLQRGDADFVPTKLIDTDFMETASDDWFTDFNNDGIADIATGRLPARSPQELSVYVNKILAYEQTTTINSALSVSDVNSGWDFENEITRLRQFIPGNVTIEEVRRGQLGDTLAKSKLLELLNNGQKIVTYAGHGSVDLWSGGLFTATDALNLHNGTKLPVFVMTSCLNAYFHDVTMDSLGEALMKAERGGAIAVWASSSLTFPQEQALMNQQFYSLLLNNQVGKSGGLLTLGEASAKAKAAIQDSDIRRSWILLGDPALRLR